eukprot:9472595-Pyramimonas_sp.AAC.1
MCHVPARAPHGANKKKARACQEQQLMLFWKENSYTCAGGEAIGGEEGRSGDWCCSLQGSVLTASPAVTLELCALDGAS